MGSRTCTAVQALDIDTAASDFQEQQPARRASARRDVGATRAQGRALDRHTAATAAAQRYSDTTVQQYKAVQQYSTCAAAMDSATTCRPYSWSYDALRIHLAVQQQYSGST